MLIDYPLEVEEQQTVTASTDKGSVLLTKGASFVAVVSICFCLAGFVFAAAIFAVVSILFVLGYSFGQDILAVRFDSDLSDFTLQDVINDLEGR